MKEESGSADKVSQYLKYLFWQQKKEDDFAFEGIDERKHGLAFSLIEKERESIGGPLGLRKEGSHQGKSSGALSRGQFAQQNFVNLEQDNVHPKYQTKRGLPIFHFCYRVHIC